MVPIITRLVIEIPFLFLGSMLLENFFGIPGLGSMTVDAINNADWPVIKAMVVLGSVLYIIGNLVSDVLYAVVDPRVVLK
jgi:peptide/nickel transport system permease protein